MLVEEEEVKVESELYNDLKRDLGKNFKLFVDTVNLKEWKKKGPYVPPEADMGSKRNSQEISFPSAVCYTPDLPYVYAHFDFLGICFGVALSHYCRRSRPS
jgi:hypothetical protein